MSTHTRIRAKYVYPSTEQRQQAIEAIEDKGYTEDTIKYTTEVIAGEKKPLIKIEEALYRNLARYTDDLSNPAEQYLYLGWTWNHNHLQITTEEVSINHDLHEWCADNEDIGPNPERTGDYSDYPTQLGWKEHAKSMFFGDPEVYAQYTDLRFS